MGMQSSLYGYIEEAWPGAAGENKELLYSNASEISKHNENIILSLPSEDEWPPVPKSIFGWAPAEMLMIGYRNRPIHFAAILKELDWELRDWLDKFETLLKKLYWESVTLHFKGSYIGSHTFQWTPTEDWVRELTKGSMNLIDTWHFESTLDEKELNEFTQKSS